MTRRILITGASIAGNTAAWWLAQHGFAVDVVERAPAFRGGGQNVDVRGEGRQVLRRMGLEAAALARATGEQGTDWVDAQDRVIARFAVADLGDGPTAELEILRGDLAELIHAPTSERVTHRFGDHITAIAQDADAATVTFASGQQARYALVIVAEGVGSSTRELLFPGENQPRWLDITLAYFSLPAVPGDGTFARQYNTTGGRGASLKPGPDNKVHAYIGVQKKPGDELEWNTAQQRRFLRETFADCAWQFPRLLAGMETTEDFYFEVLRQVRMPRWSQGRVVLTGDAAWCATPMSGIGTTLAVVGAYVLAGEIASHADHRDAFAAYERRMRPFVREGQGVPKFLPRLLWPHSRAGLALLRGAMRVAGTPLVRKSFSTFFLRDSSKIQLPDYPLPATG
ncbi:FAD-dependent monooxygenase [Xanthomonas maliensis]|uniref:FAD-dependent monooxygenase n=1 Tax=Xanthomonas maliensis TaxID=1321368 RepID=UPI0003A73EFD|nr:FAD-dependent monooxygenase [Xanthomonas maliensis]KAB7767054.1 FAD-binding monooxygenase [Xanthomonas maliensis]